MKEIIKTLLPISGGLMIGDSIGTMTTRPTLGVIELVLGIAMVSYTFYLILKKWQAIKS